jgi:double-strand break repair protein MRE11
VEEVEVSEDEPPAPKKRTNRAAVLRYAPACARRALRTAHEDCSQPAPKAAAAKKKAPAATQQTLAFAPSARAGSSRAAATKAKGRVKEVVGLFASLRA